MIFAWRRARDRPRVPAVRKSGLLSPMLYRRLLTGRFIGLFRWQIYRARVPSLAGPGAEPAPDNHFGNQVIGRVRHPDSEAGVKFPVRPEVQIQRGQYLLLLIMKGIETGHRSQRSVILDPDVYLLSRHTRLEVR